MFHLIYQPSEKDSISQNSWHFSEPKYFLCVLGIFRGYGPNDVKTFLEENGVIESVISKLFEEQVTGHMLIDLSEEDLKDSLSSLLQARNIKTKVKNFIGVPSEVKFTGTSKRGQAF